MRILLFLFLSIGLFAQNSNSLQFDATGDYITFTDAPAGNTGDATIILSVKVATGGTGTRYTLSHFAATGRVLFGVDGDSLWYRFGGAALGTVGLTESANVVNGTWETIAIVQTSDIKIYHVESKTLLKTAVKSGGLWGGTTWYIGQNSLASTVGYVDEFAYFARAVSIDSLNVIRGCDYSNYNPTFYFKLNGDAVDAAGALTAGTGTSVIWATDVPFSSYCVTSAIEVKRSYSGFSGFSKY